MKKFYTDKDIEELHHSGVKTLRVDDDVVLTDLAYEKAKRLNVRLVYEYADMPPAAPVRPYLSDMKPRHANPKFDPVSQSSSQPQSDVAQRIHSAVLARLGDRVDAKLLDNIIQRVVKATGLK